jgi:hypothetical protein
MMMTACVLATPACVLKWTDRHTYVVAEQAHMDALKTRQKERGAKRRENRALG